MVYRKGEKEHDNKSTSLRLTPERGREGGGAEERETIKNWGWRWKAEKKGEN